MVALFSCSASEPPALVATPPRSHGSEA